MKNYSQENLRKVLETLASHKSMLFLELSSLCDIDEQELHEIIQVLAEQGLVKVVDQGKVMDEIVTIRGKAHRQGALAAVR